MMSLASSPSKISARMFSMSAADLFILFRHRGRDPERLALPEQPRKRGYEPPASAPRDELPGRIALEGGRASVREEDERGSHLVELGEDAQPVAQETRHQ